MAQLTVAAGVTFQNPITILEGDTRTPGWTGGLALGGLARSSTITKPASIDPYAGYTTSFPGTRALGTGTALTRTASGIDFPVNATDVYTGYHISLTTTRTASLPTGSQRTTTGLTIRGPVDLTEVTTPPVVYTVGNVNDRVQRQQKFGVDAIFYKDAGSKSVRTNSDRLEGSQYLENVSRVSTDIRTSLSGFDLATQVLPGLIGSRQNVATAASNLLTVDPIGGVGTRSRVGLYGSDLLQLVDLGQVAHRTAVGRSGGEKKFPPSNDKLISFIDLPGTSGSTTFGDVAATLQTGEPSLSLTADSQGSVWFRWEPNYSGTGEFTSSTGVGLEVFNGPEPIYPIVGINNYMGEWDATTTYHAGDVVLFSDGNMYTTSATISTTTPDHVDVADVTLTATIASGFGSTAGPIDISFPQRGLLSAGTYFIVGRSATATDFHTRPFTDSGAVVSLSSSSSGYSYGTTSWNISGGYSFSFALIDSTTATVRGSSVTTTHTDSYQIPNIYQKFTLTQDTYLDTIRVWSTGYQTTSGSTSFSIVTDLATPATAVSAKAFSSLNPWSVTPNTNPLQFTNLLPLGSAEADLSFDTRAGETYYLRTYSITGESSSLPLTWATAPTGLTVTLVDDTLEQTPGYVQVSVIDALPGETVNYSLDSDATVIGSVTVDAAGFSERILVEVPALLDGAHLLNAIGATSGRVGNAAFTVSAVDVYTVPDPVDPTPAPVIIPAPIPIPRWRFQDPTDQTYWDMPINPSKTDSVLLPRVLTAATTTAIFGQPIVFEGGRQARRWTLTGNLFTLADVRKLRSWLRAYRIYIHDDLGRIFIVKVIGVQTVPVRDTTHPEHHSYVVTTLLYGQVTS